MEKSIFQVQEDHALLLKQNLTAQVWLTHQFFKNQVKTHPHKAHFWDQTRTPLIELTV